MTVTKNYLFGYCIAVIVNYALFCKVKSTKKTAKYRINKQILYRKHCCPVIKSTIRMQIFVTKQFPLSRDCAKMYWLC